MGSHPLICEFERDVSARPESLFDSMDFLNDLELGDFTLNNPLSDLIDCVLENSDSDSGISIGNKRHASTSSNDSNTHSSEANLGGTVVDAQCVLTDVVSKSFSDAPKQLDFSEKQVIATVHDQSAVRHVTCAAVTNAKPVKIIRISNANGQPNKALLFKPQKNSSLSPVKNAISKACIGNTFFTTKPHVDVERKQGIAATTPLVGSRRLITSNIQTNFNLSYPTTGVGRSPALQPFLHTRQRPIKKESEDTNMQEVQQELSEVMDIPNTSEICEFLKNDDMSDSVLDRFDSNIAGDHLEPMLNNYLYYFDSSAPHSSFGSDRLSSGTLTTSTGFSASSIGGLFSRDNIERIKKKQERMIKNRHAASLSRMRKKEYLERLEMRLEQLKRENMNLWRQNEEWRARCAYLQRCIEEMQVQSVGNGRLVGAVDANESDRRSGSYDSTTSDTSSLDLSIASTDVRTTPTGGCSTTDQNFTCHTVPYSSTLTNNSLSVHANNRWTMGNKLNGSSTTTQIISTPQKSNITSTQPLNLGRVGSLFGMGQQRTGKNLFPINGLISRRRLGSNGLMSSPTGRTRMVATTTTSLLAVFGLLSLNLLSPTVTPPFPKSPVDSNRFNPWAGRVPIPSSQWSAVDESRHPGRRVLLGISANDHRIEGAATIKYDNDTELNEVNMRSDFELPVHDDPSTNASSSNTSDQSPNDDIRHLKNMTDSWDMDSEQDPFSRIGQVLEGWLQQHVAATATASAEFTAPPLDIKPNDKFSQLPLDEHLPKREGKSVDPSHTDKKLDSSEIPNKPHQSAILSKQSGRWTPTKDRESISKIEHGIQLYHRPRGMSVEELLKFAGRRNDTVYFVSLQRDHLLYPATEPSFGTQRPKMTFLLPANHAQNGSADGADNFYGFAVLQLECEVFNATLLRLHDHASTKPGR